MNNHSIFRIWLVINKMLQGLQFFFHLSKTFFLLGQQYKKTKPNTLFACLHVRDQTVLTGIEMQDELLWAATWLFLATKRPVYLKYIQEESISASVSEFSWDLKYAGAQILLTEVSQTFHLFHKICSQKDSIMGT